MSLIIAAAGHTTRNKPYVPPRLRRLRNVEAKRMQEDAARAIHEIDQSAATYLVNGAGDDLEEEERVRRAADVKMGMRLDLQRRLTNERLDIPVAAGAGALRLEYLGATHGLMQRMDTCHKQLHRVGAASEREGRKPRASRDHAQRPRPHTAPDDMSNLGLSHAKNLVLAKRDNMAVEKKMAIYTKTTEANAGRASRIFDCQRAPRINTFRNLGQAVIVAERMRKLQERKEEKLRDNRTPDQMFEDMMKRQREYEAKGSFDPAKFLDGSLINEADDEDAAEEEAMLARPGTPAEKKKTVYSGKKKGRPQNPDDAASGAPEGVPEKPGAAAAAAAEPDVTKPSAAAAAAALPPVGEPGEAGPRPETAPPALGDAPASELPPVTPPPSEPAGKAKRAWNLLRSSHKAFAASPAKQGGGEQAASSAPAPDSDGDAKQAKRAWGLPSPKFGASPSKPGESTAPDGESGTAQANRAWGSWRKSPKADEPEPGSEPGATPGDAEAAPASTAEGSSSEPSKNDSK